MRGLHARNAYDENISRTSSISAIHTAITVAQTARTPRRERTKPGSTRSSRPATLPIKEMAACSSGYVDTNAANRIRSGASHLVLVLVVGAVQVSPPSDKKIPKLNYRLPL
jgi:hypothetical protein